VQNQSKNVFTKVNGKPAKEQCKIKAKMLLPKSMENRQKKSSAKTKAKQLLSKSIENQQKSIAKTLPFPSLILDDDDEEQDII
jgi:hypothetical protein